MLHECVHGRPGLVTFAIRRQLTEDGDITTDSICAFQSCVMFLAEFFLLPWRETCIRGDFCQVPLSQWASTHRRNLLVTL